ncbi:hypothetical protein ACFLXI_08475 [Chloroflexota bacterium]
MSGINFQRTYQLGDGYEGVQERARLKLAKYWEYPNLITFKDQDRSVTFTTERLIPTLALNRPRVMLLFSNPHPHSVDQGMFLSPNTIGRENQFWPVMEKAGWLPIPKEDRTPAQLANICLNVSYEGPFDLIFYCYYAFPTDYPKDIQEIFGKVYFNQTIEPQSKDEFQKTIQELSTEAVVTFNKGVFNLVSKEPVARYIDRLKAGELIQSQIKGVDKHIPIFLTFPTGWRFHKDYRDLRVASLDRIRKAICSASRSSG